DQQFAHHGWSGLVSSVEDFPDNLFDRRRISLHDLIVFELLLEIDALDFKLGKNWTPLGVHINSKPVDLFAEAPRTELREVFTLWQDAFEWSYYDDVIAGLLSSRKQKKNEAAKSFQAVFCIDERECSIRRHVENSDPDCETLGAPGFFGAEFYFQQQGGNFYEKLCPAPVTPKFLIKEYSVPEERPHETLYTRRNQSLIGSTIITFALGVVAGFKLLLTIFRPKMSPAISNAFTHMHRNSKLTIENTDVNDRENDLQIGFTVTEMADRAEGLLRGIGLVKEFAPIIYLVAHGSSSANNPHHSAHDCGACSGRPGSVNARVCAFIANHPRVREILSERGLKIPASTQFVGGLHDTAADQMQFYDATILSPENELLHKKNYAAFENALNRNAKERSRRFASIPTKQNLPKVREAIRLRSVSMFEPRPELGHGTNSLCIVGSRELTKKVFLDRRAFLNSYDHTTDPEGKLLTGVMRPLGIVCGGINLEYYFSRVDNHKLGAGTKLPHHVLGLVGVTNSADGDLRPGLPLQMIEVHDPVRLLLVVEHFPDVVLKTIQSSPEMYEWYVNEWVHIMAIHPETNQSYYFKNGEFRMYEPLKKSLPVAENTLELVESAIEMETNQIADATKENLPVYILK
ncbi:MAG TPA: putative inorganic carbon transporter subunit DabA, partial [Bacteroidia bacterium]|nr:putative inorganic carbon transporter subunit DabA [Bacteroidia bacterium]